MKTCRLIFISVLAVLCACITVFSGCWLLSSDGIGAVRSRAEKMRYEMSETIMDAFKNKDVAAVKNLFCPKSQEIEDIDGQIEKTFSFMEGDIQSYEISKSTGYESVSKDYGKITQYTFGNSIFINTDAGRKYTLYLNVHFIELDSVIEGMTNYNLYENDRDYEDIKRCSAGFGWSSPFDAELGIMSATLIKAVAGKDADAVKSLMCEKALRDARLDGEIAAVFEFFDGTPLFSERVDGLYNSDDNENDFNCRVLGYEIKRDGDGNATEVWCSVITQNILTDSGRHYSLDFSIYLKNDETPSYEGIAYFSFEDFGSDTEKQVGGWVHS